MATASQLPGRLDLAFTRGADYGTLVDFSIDLTGYQLAAEIQTLARETVMAVTVTAVDLEAGQVNVSLTNEQTSQLAAGTYRWQLDWAAPGSLSRIALAGFVEVEK